MKLASPTKLVSQCSFRDLVHVLCLLECSFADLGSHVAEDLRPVCPEGADCVLAYPYVDHEEGLTFEVLAPACSEPQRVFCDHDPLLSVRARVFLREDCVASRHVAPLVDTASLTSDVREHCAWIDSAYRTSDGCRATEEVEEIDGLRSSRFVDDVEVLLPAGLAGRGRAWARLSRVTGEGYLEGNLLDASHCERGGPFGPTVLLELSRGVAGEYSLTVASVLEVVPPGTDPRDVACRYVRSQDELCGGGISLAIGCGYLSRAADDGTWELSREDCLEASRWLERSVSFGNVASMVRLGYVCCCGVTGLRDYERAFGLFSLARVRLDPEATCKLGDMRERGLGCDRDPDEAFSLYKEAYGLGRGDADPCVRGCVALRLARCYEEGVGCEGDRRRALDLYIEAEVGLMGAVEAGRRSLGTDLREVRDAIGRLGA